MEHLHALLRCSYKYDALGNLYRKLCSDGDDYSYLMDPFGRYGPDAIAEVGITTGFISCMEFSDVHFVLMIFCILLADFW